MLVGDKISSFIQGVSEQPDRLKFPNQLRQQINGYSSPLNGLEKRYPTEHIAKLINGQIGKAYVHFIEKDNGEEYVIIIPQNDIKVFDLQGNPKTVNKIDGTEYINVPEPRYNLDAISVADYTFILNKTKQTKMTDDVTVDPFPTSALVFVKNGNINTDYKIYINDIQQAAVTPTTDASAKTNQIAYDLRTQLYNNLGTTDWNFVRKGNVILIQNTAGNDFTIRTEDSNGDNDIFSFKGEAEATSDLPNIAAHGFILKIRGSKESTKDDYYVQFKVTPRIDAEGNEVVDDIGVGGWKECPAVGIKYKIDPTTMPFALIRTETGDFSFEHVPYTDRTVGDDDSNKIPSFIGSTINKLLVYKNRLGLLSNENIILSSSRDIFSYWKETTLTELDTDVIDVACSAGTQAITNLRYSVPFDRDLLLFSDKAQFTLAGGDVLTAKTVSIDLTTEYASSKKVSPVGAGNNIFFAFEKNDYTGLMQFYVNQSQVNDALDITNYVATYIPKNVFKIASSTLDNILCLISEETPDTLYIHKYMINDGEKIQSSWSHWTFKDACILGAEFIQNYLYLVIQYPDGVYLERMNLTPNNNDIDYTTEAGLAIKFNTRLDRKVSNLVPVYDEVSNESIFVIPYQTTGEIVLVDELGMEISKVEEELIDGYPVITVSGDYRNKKVIAGINYLFYIEFANFFYRKDNELNNPTVIDGSVQIWDLYLSYANTGYFKVDVTPLYQDTSTYEFTGKIIGTPSTTINTTPLSSGEFPIPVLAKNTEVKIELSSDIYLPVSLISANWTGDYSKNGI